MKCGKFGDRDDIEHKYLQNRWPVVKVAPHPTLIIWKNLGYGKINRCTRSVIVSLITIFLMILGFWIISRIFD